MSCATRKSQLSWTGLRHHRSNATVKHLLCKKSVDRPTFAFADAGWASIRFANGLNILHTLKSTRPHLLADPHPRCHSNFIYPTRSTTAKQLPHRLSIPRIPPCATRQKINKNIQTFALALVITALWEAVRRNRRIAKSPKRSPLG